MTSNSKNIWDKLTDAEKTELGQGLNKILQEEFDREFVNMVKEQVKPNEGGIE
jgi:hypothetical protein